MRMNTTSQQDNLRRKNIRTALLLGAFAIFILVTSVPFWQGLFKIVGTQAG